jgi:uncharacterized membrane protein YbaN (DUF454 family)
MEPQVEVEVRPARSRLHRWLLVTAGVILVGIGAIGVVVPGLPTVIFLLGASWCFARSCPWLEDRLIRVPLFRPFFVYLDNGARMPRRVVIWTLVAMWTAIGVSSFLVGTGADPRPGLAGVIGVAGLVGTYFFLRMARKRMGPAPRVSD